MNPSRFESEHQAREAPGGVLSKALPRSWSELKKEWPILTFNQRFEASVACVLTLVIAVIVLVALYRLIVGVVDTLVLRTLNPLDHTIFQSVFGQIMTLLIALEFNHTLQSVITGERGIVQVRTVILIALLALARKVIVVDLYAQSSAAIIGLAALSLALAVCYWMLRDRSAWFPRFRGRRRRVVASGMA